MVSINIKELFTDSNSYIKTWNVLFRFRAGVLQTIMSPFQKRFSFLADFYIPSVQPFLFSSSALFLWSGPPQPHHSLVVPPGYLVENGWPISWVTDFNKRTLSSARVRESKWVQIQSRPTLNIFVLTLASCQMISYCSMYLMSMFSKVLYATQTGFKM